MKVCLLNDSFPPAIDAVANAVTGKKKSKNSKGVAEKAIGSATSSALRTLTRSILGSLIK